MTRTEEAQRLLAEAFARFLEGVQAINGARAAAQTALESSPEIIAEAARRDARDGIRMAIQARILKFEKGPPETSAILDSLVENAASHQLTSLQAAIDASALIFMHLSLETGIVDLCRATMHLTPESWASKVDAKKLQLAEVKGRSYEDLLVAKLRDYADTLGREPLPKNVERLLGVLQPEPGELSDSDSPFSMPRLRKLDDLRHEIAHTTGPRVIDDLGDELWFMQGVFFRLWWLVMAKHAIPLDDQVLRQAISRQSAAEE